jgi:hypothetical protein
MREIRPSGSEGGGAFRSPYPYQSFAPSKITPCRSFPRKREFSSFWTDVDPRLRGGDNNGDFHFVGWSPGPCTPGMTSAHG